MRERTTWDRKKIAAQLKDAEDPRAMNQDHHSQQPAADAYQTGGPSEFAEDVHPATDTWKAEDSGGDTNRNAIGMPEFRGDTFKAAAEIDPETVLKKSNLAVKVARHMLPKTASETDVEDQALALMDVSDASLIETANRMAGITAAKKSEDEDDDEEETKTDEDDDETKTAKSKKSEDDEDEDEDEDKEESDDDESDDKPAAKPEKGKVPPQFQKKEEKKAACEACMDQAYAAAGTGNRGGFDEAMQMAMNLGMGDEPEAPMGMDEAPADEAPMAAGPMGEDEAMLDEMLTDPVAPVVEDAVVMAGDEIQLDGPSMDVGEVPLGQEDALLTQLFNESPEVQAAQAVLASDKTRTVGTKPKEGVAKIGAGHAKAASSKKNEVGELSALWASAPDVSKSF